ncbi:putative transposase for the insertion element IS2404 [Mycobacterium ulcerans str. Harvey]|uniref:Transposase for the insertion element IS2404 n=1 Tax=Mycobacterium ulcerans str. Harvey TaxID=1299332 RepID=A0ABP3A7P6_MYCUL|nr:putative transposase for the insertion element IS2404 [Mycobacterium ulcerans str. Harvey]
MVPIALDGKMLRGALRAKATATHLVSVFAHRARLVLGQLAVAEKSNEIPCVRALLTLLPVACGGWSPWMRCIPRSSPRS